MGLLQAFKDAYDAGKKSWKSHQDFQTHHKAEVSHLEDTTYKQERLRRHKEKMFEDFKKAEEKGKYRAMPLKEKVDYHLDKTAESLGRSARKWHERGVRPVEIAAKMHTAGHVLVHGYDERPGRKIRSGSSRRSVRVSSAGTRTGIMPRYYHGLPEFKKYDGKKFEIYRDYDPSDKPRAKVEKDALEGAGNKVKMLRMSNLDGEPRLVIYVKPTRSTA